MAPRDEMREAKKEAGLCLHGGCGSRALEPPLIEYCDKHLPEHPHQVLQRRQKKPPQ